MAKDLSPSQLLLARLRTQRLTGAPFPTAATAVGSLTCVQSQDPLGANWSLGMRVKGATERSIIAAYDRGDFLRTHILRPTWHYVLPADIRWILELTSPHVLRSNRTISKRLGLDAKLLTRAKVLMEKALGDGHHLTREQLSAELAKGKIVAEGQRMAYIMMEAELTGFVCSGAMQGKQHTYALLAERAPQGTKVGREEAVAELLRRFVVGHAPTTLKHFSWWSGLKVTEARKAREALKSELKGAMLGGVEWLGGTAPATRDSRPATLLVPEYDEVLVGTADVGIPRLMADRRIKGRTTNTFDRPLLIGGQWAGTWRRTMGTKQIELEVEWFSAPSRVQQAALAREIDHYGRYSGREVVLRVTR